ncbi:hypothetical protein LOTGIDRAFT_158390 [Lottia gigantea]|uniref:Double jelly roll-like domain-containing protein n=1 Tax=Lottia gigantea TaxID=225164 RepID=V4AW39_LOTGI|nr:hypothetical protein LOTGIDRAFT_158390 [Lottia gigantea]ESO99310.1 hypothetical protein LOTGIDRAFT_158390 [Lottia gigantea]
MANRILDPILRLYDPIRYSFNKKKEDYIIISPTVGSKSQLNDGGRITFEINSLSNWLLLSDAYSRCDFKIKDGTQNQVPQTNTTLENNFFPSLFSEMVLDAGSNPIETIKHPGEFDTMLKTVLYPKDFDSVSGWIPDVGDGSVLKEPVRNVANDADLDRVRVVARNTIERVGRAANHGFEKRVLQYNNIVENNRWGNYVNWKLYPLFGLLEHKKVFIGLPYKIHLQREINDDKIFFGENGSDAKLEITNLQLFIPVITPSIEVETRIFNSLTKDIEIAFLHRNTVGSMTLTGESTTWPITNTIKPARYLMVGFKNLPDSQTNNNNVFRVAMNQTQNPLIHNVQVRLNNDNYPNQPLTINPTTKDYNELYRNYKNMCELFGNLPQFEYVDFALNHPIFCFDLSAHQEDLFKTGVNINIHIEKTQGDVTGYCLLLEEAKHLIKIADRRMIRIEDDIDLERIDANAKEGGFIFSLPLIFAGITAAATVAGATAGGVSVVSEKKAAIAEAAATKATEEKKAAEEHKHNLKMEKLAAEVKKPKTEKKGSGVGDMIGTIKEFGKRFSEETKKTVKQGLNKLVDSIDTGEIKVKHKGNGIFLKKYTHWRRNISFKV